MQQHKLILDQREKLTLTGVTEVMRFEETGVDLRTELGILSVQGQDLHLKALAPESGQVEIEGSISGLFYEQPREPAGWLRRLFS